MLDEGKIFATGGHEILAPENVVSIYKVRVSIKDHCGIRLVVPEKP